MGKFKRLWLIAAICLLLAGVLIFGGVMTVIKWDFTRLSTSKYETNEHTVTQPYQNISINTNTAKVVLVASEQNESRVICHEQKKQIHTVSVKDGTLMIEVTDTRKWYDHIGIQFDIPTVTVAIPRGNYGSLTVKNKTGDVMIPRDFQFDQIDVTVSTGDVTLEASVLGAVKVRSTTGDILARQIAAGSLDLSVSTGRVTVSQIHCGEELRIKTTTGDAILTDVQCKTLWSNGSTGRIRMTDVIAAESVTIERDTGDVTLDRCDAAALLIKTDTGDVTGTLRTEKVFLTQTDTGRVHVPNTATGGQCQITTDTGNIKIEILA